MDKLKTKFNRFYGPALLSGLLLFLSFPRIDFYPLAWIAMVPLLIFLYDKDNWTAFKAGFFAGIVYFFGTTYWIYHSMNQYGSIPLIPSLFIVLILCAYLGLYPAIFSLLYARYIRKTDFPVLFIAPILWTTLEFVRSYALTGFPWSSLGYSQYRFLPLIQIADITGIYGVSFLIVAVNGAIADLLLLKRRHEERPLYSFLPTLSGFVLLALALIATLSYGFFRLHQERAGRDITVAIIQGNIEQDKKWDPSYQKTVLDTYRELSLSVAGRKPDLIVWPETSAPFYFGNDKILTEEMVAFEKQLNSYLLFGSVLLKKQRFGPMDHGAEKTARKPEIRATNSAVLLNKDGNVSYIYDKIHLVPFGEYVPLRSLLFFVEKLTVGIGDYSPGYSYTKAVTPFGSFGTLICYEIIFPGLVRKFYVRGGDFIVTITNDAWFGNTYGPYQHFSMSVFRAIENRKPVIRAANTGISGFIDSCGRILDKTRLFQKTSLVGNVSTDRTLSIYTKYGDIFSYLCMVCFLTLLTKRK